MSCAEDLTSDVLNGRTFAMYHRCGIQFAVNLMDRIGGTIPLHTHDYDHISFVRHGVFLVDIAAPERAPVRMLACSADMRWHPACTYDGLPPQEEMFDIPAGHQHTFTLLACLEGRSGNVTCMWGSGSGGEVHD